MFLEEAKRIIYTYNSTFDEDDINIDKKDADKVIHNAFNLIKVIENLLSNLFDELEKANETYRNNLNYFKQQGGIYPSYRYNQDIKDTIDSLKQIKLSIYDNINDIKDKKPWAYKRSFKEAIDKIFNE